MTFLRLAHAMAPYCGLLGGLTALTWPSAGALFGSDRFPSPVSVEALSEGHVPGEWLELQRGTLLLTELVMDAEVTKGTGEETVNAYLVPYVARDVTGPTAGGLRSNKLIVVSFSPGEFELRFPRAYAFLEGDTLSGDRQHVNAGESPVDSLGESLDAVFDRRSCEVLRSDLSSLSPHVRHFLEARWGVDDESILVVLAGRKPMGQREAMAWVCGGLALAAAGAIALGRRVSARRAITRAGW